MKELIFPLSERKICWICAQERKFSVSGVLYTARDAAHKKICALIEAGGELPFELNGQAVYYTGSRSRAFWLSNRRLRPHDKAAAWTLTRLCL